VVESIGNDTIEHRNCYQQAAPARQLPNISSIPYVTYGHCIIGYLEQAGGSPEWIRLGEVGIRGNGHFMHLEKNNLEIAALVQQWIDTARQ
jgi:hypothetical protein